MAVFRSISAINVFRIIQFTIYVNQFIISNLHVSFFSLFESFDYFPIYFLFVVCWRKDEKNTINVSLTAMISVLFLALPKPSTKSRVLHRWKKLWNALWVVVLKISLLVISKMSLISIGSCHSAMKKINFLMSLNGCFESSRVSSLRNKPSGAKMCMWLRHTTVRRQLVEIVKVMRKCVLQGTMMIISLTVTESLVLYWLFSWE